jgi:hypothetical protein
MTIEQVPNIPIFRMNTAAFVHEQTAGALANGDGDHTYARVRGLRLRPRKPADARDGKGSHSP